MRKEIMMIVTRKRPLIDVVHYIVGKLRYRAYYSKNFKWLIRQHIREQIDWRIKVMDKECYNNGECKICGCQTTALQMADKSCDKPCYPAIMDKKSWFWFSKKATPFVTYTHVFFYDVTKNIYKIVKK